MKLAPDEPAEGNAPTPTPDLLGGQAPIRVLIVEDEHLVARHIASTLRKRGFEVIGRAASGLDAVEMARKLAPDLVLADVRLRDAMDGVEAVTEIRAHRNVAVVYLTAYSDKETMARVVATDPGGYLIKPFNEQGLICAVEVALRRHRAEQSIREDSMLDELTGLHNRRAFMALGTQQLKIASRYERPVAVYFFDVDGLKRVNDELGHARGDALIKRAARVLASTFRRSDIVARLGGDEFAALMVDAGSESAEMLIARLERNIAEANAHVLDGATLAMSMGVAHSDGREVEIADLLELADARMYGHKRSRRRAEARREP